MNAFGLAPLVIFIPAAGFLLNALFGRRFVDSDRKVGEQWSGWLASGAALTAFAIALLLAASLVANDFEAVTITLFDWITIPAASFNVAWAIQVDTLSVTMMLVVAGVGSLIHIYAIGYMHGDPDFSRFFAYMNLFLFFMLILVSANNYLMLFVGWEGVGLCSYLLIGFWFDRVDKQKQPMNANAARKAFVVNRVGDLGMILALILLFWAFGSLDFDTIFHSAEGLFRSGQEVSLFGTEVSIGLVLTAVTALFLVGAAGKSAQIPLYVWLPDAMAGPTPVSALIHAATMVTAGIYLIVRSNVLYEIVRASGETLPLLGISTPTLVAITGATTALLAGLIAFTQFDIKKVLAYSTISQLGFMIAAVGMGAYVAAMFHLVVHAFFKALLFLSSGNVIHGMEHGHHHISDHGDEGADEGEFDPQDMRNMGGLRHRMKTTFIVFTIGALALAGIVPLAGFWSKDEILAHAEFNRQLGVEIVLILAAICTAFYMGRQLSMVFLRKPRTEAANHASESPRLMTWTLFILAALTILGGLLNVPFFSAGAAEHAEEEHELGLNLELEQWLEHSIKALDLERLEGLVDVPDTPLSVDFSVAGLSTLLALAALGLALFVVYRNRPEKAEDPDPLQKTPIWWFGILPLNTFYMRTIVPAYNATASWLAFTVDWRFWHDWFHDRVIRDGYVAVANFVNKSIDVAIIDNGLVNGTAKAARWCGFQLRRTQTGYIRNYALAVFLGVIAIVVYVIFVAN
ncbi:MAG: NADH-quinone oxidoreductase subunit L [Candidatus Promineifilaceae bacterium]